MEKYITSPVSRSLFYSVMTLAVVSSFLLGILWHNYFLPPQIVIVRFAPSSVPESIIRGQAFPLKDMQIIDVNYIAAKSKNETRVYNLTLKNLSNAYSAKNLVFDVSFSKSSASQNIIDTGTGFEIASDYAKVLTPGQTRTITVAVDTSLGLTQNINETFILRSAIAL